MRAILLAATVMVAACSPAIEPELKNSRFVKTCEVGRYGRSYAIVQLENGELVASSSLEPRWESEIIRVAPGTDPMTVCNWQSFRNQ